MKLPDPKSSRLEQTLDCARLAVLAYSDPEEEDLQRKSFVFGGDHGFVAWNDSAVCVVVSGSDDLSDWLPFGSGNLAAKVASLDGVKGHAGIITAAAGIARQLTALGLPADRTWYITGHSRGGAIAHWLPQLMTRIPEDTHVVSFGAPRSVIGDLTVQVARWSYVLPSDPVPLLPIWSKGWRDPGFRLFLHADGIDDEFPTALWQYLKMIVTMVTIYLVNRMRGRLFALGAVGRWVVQRHVMLQYVEQLEKLFGPLAVRKSEVV